MRSNKGIRQVEIIEEALGGLNCIPEIGIKKFFIVFFTEPVSCIMLVASALL